MKLDTIEWRELTLEPKAVKAETKKSPIQGMLAIGAVDVFDAIELSELKEEALDAEVSALSRTHVFKCLRIPLSVRRIDGVDLRLLIVEVVLKASGDQAVSWSLDPERVEQETKVKATSSISAGLTIKAVKLGASEGASEEYVLRHPEVEAFGLGTKLSGWEFRPLKDRPYSGIQLLSEVVRVPKGVKCNAAVRIRADIQERGWLFPHEVRTRDSVEEVARITVV